VNRKFTWTAGVIALGVAVYVGSRLFAQPPAPQASAEPRTRIALLNLGHVVKNYRKFQQFQEELKKAVEPYQLKDKQYRQQIEAHAKALQDPAKSQAEKEVLEKNLRTYQRQLEDNANEVKTFVGKKNDDQMVILYREVQEVAQRYAVSHGFELVLHYNDALPNTPDYYTPMNVARKMQAGACVPLYAANGMDISNPLIQTLNNAYGNGPAAMTPAAPPAGGAPARP
jgi:Skp family chaperone for outer membrane proteins